MENDRLKTMHLFAGAGGGLLADLILGHEPVVAVEWEPYPCQVLRERAADGWFPELHVWEGDVRLFDSSEYAGRVDCIHAGFPCQPFSVAGKRGGSTDTRELFGEILRIVQTVRPKYLFLENVPGILTSRSPTCVCGWPYRRRGVSENPQAVEENDIDLHTCCANKHDSEGEYSSRSAGQGVWREDVRPDIQGQQVGGSVAMAYQRGRSQRLCEEDISVLDAEETASGCDSRVAGFEGVAANEQKRDAKLEPGSEGCCGETQETDARPEQERPRCPECGRGLLLEAGLTWYIDSILWALSEIGFTAEWTTLRASDCGAKHHRDRWWLLADTNGHNGSADERKPDTRTDRRNKPSWGCEVVADTKRKRQQGQGEHEQSEYSAQAEDREAVNAVSGGGQDFWEVESSVGRVADGVAYRVDRLKALGNGQVPLQAAVAWKLLGGP